jgi:hypothetical protein
MCGGKDHSTTLLYKAIADNPKYAELSEEIEGLAESRVLEKLVNRFYDIPSIQASGCTILIEDQSTNCSTNATETREILRRTKESKMEDIERRESLGAMEDKGGYLKLRYDLIPSHHIPEWSSGMTLAPSCRIKFTIYTAVSRVIIDGA